VDWLLGLVVSFPGRFTPFLGWIRELRDRKTLKADIVAGITVAMVLVPQSMAYAQLAGLPPYFGLYASLLPPIVASFFGSSRQLATGPVAVVSLMTAAALEPLAATGSEGFFAYAMALAVLVGLFQMSLGLLRLGVVVDLLSHPVVVGFTNAGALIIATSQIGKLFGVTVEKSVRHYETVYNTMQAAMESTHVPTLLMAILAISVMLGVKRFLPRMPNVLAAVTITTMVSWVIEFEAKGGRVVGVIPDGLPGFAVPVFSADVLLQLMGSAVVISLIGFMEAIAIAKAMAARTRQRLDTNQELVGQGLSNVVSGLFSGYPVSGSFSRSAININAGALTGFSSVVTGGVVGITLLFLTPLIYHLPVATLGVVIILAVINLFKISPIIHAWRAQPHDAAVAVITFGLTMYLAPHLEFGVLMGVLLSLALFVIRSMRPRVAVLSRYKDGTLRDITVFPLPTSELISVIRFDGSLYFANAGYFEDKILEVVALNPKLRYIVIDASGINQMDATGEEVLHHLVERLKDHGIEMVVAGMKKQFMDVIRRTRLIEYLGEEHFFSYIQNALDYVWDRLGQDYDRTTCPLRMK
jgi:sulfate permease, SulP family